MKPLGVGFSFRGLHSDDMNVILANNDKEMHILTNDITYSSETVDGYDGAYPVGSQESPIAFEIQIFCEDFTEADLNKIREWFKRDSYGQLVFDHRPYKYYNVRVTSEISPPMYVRYDREKGVFVYSGIMSVTLTAFTPRSYLLDDVAEDYPDIGTGLETVNLATAIVEKSKRPNLSTETYTADADIILLNQGNAPAKLSIEISGTSMDDGVTIENRTTNETITITAPDAELHEYFIDGVHGRVTTTDNKLSDSVRTGQFITLAPSCSAIRNLTATANGTANIVLSDNLDAKYVGAYIYIGSKWVKIVSIADDTITVSSTVDGGTYSGCDIVFMNELHITTNGANVEIRFVYKDTFY